MSPISVDFGRTIEGLCPDVEHGKLERTEDGWGRCTDCENDYKVVGQTLHIRNLESVVETRGMSVILVGASDDRRESEQ